MVSPGSQCAQTPPLLLLPGEAPPSPRPPPHSITAGLPLSRAQRSQGAQRPGLSFKLLLHDQPGTDESLPTASIALESLQVCVTQIHWSQLWKSTLVITHDFLDVLNSMATTLILSITKTKMNHRVDDIENTARQCTFGTIRNTKSRKGKKVRQYFTRHFVVNTMFGVPF